MAHNMKDNDKALSVREPMWHAAQTDSITLASAPTRSEAESRVSDYQVIREPLYRKVPVINEDDSLGEMFIRYEEEQLNVRSDTGVVFGSVPTGRIDPQPAEVWDIADFFMEHNKGLAIETAGTYNDGADMYILMKLPEMLTIKGDPNGNSWAYIALQNAWYVGKSLRCQPTNVRIVCNNTSSHADMVADTQGVNLSLAHTLNLRERIEEMQDFMSTWRQGISEWQEAKEFLATQKVNIEQTNWFIDQFIPEHPMITDRARQNMELARTDLLFEIFNGYNDGITNTALGLFEAASSYVGHVQQAATPMTRFKRAMLTPSTVLSDAARLAREAVSV
jgi:phage/plasmid-like protein (TIGR03299 family)